MIVIYGTAILVESDLYKNIFIHLTRIKELTNFHLFIFQQNTELSRDDVFISQNTFFVTVLSVFSLSFRDIGLLNCKSGLRIKAYAKDVPCPCSKPTLMFSYKFFASLSKIELSIGGVVVFGHREEYSLHLNKVFFALSAISLGVLVSLSIVQFQPILGA